MTTEKGHTYEAVVNGQTVVVYPHESGGYVNAGDYRTTYTQEETKIVREVQVKKDL